VIVTPLEIKGAVAGVTTSVFILIATFTAGGIYRNSIERETKPGNNPLDAATLAAKGRPFFFQSCAHCHGQDADGGEDAPSLLKLQISGAHMALVIQSGIKDEMPSFAKKQRAGYCRYRGLPQDAALIQGPRVNKANPRKLLYEANSPTCFDRFGLRHGFELLSLFGGQRYRLRNVSWRSTRHRMAVHADAC
jgi:hypothetical protein